MFCANVRGCAALYPCRTCALVAFEKSWVRKENLRSPQRSWISSSLPNGLFPVSPCLETERKFTFYCVTEWEVRPQRERASRPTFPETRDLFWLKQHRKWWNNYLREHTHDSKQTAHLTSVVIPRQHRLVQRGWEELLMLFIGFECCVDSVRLQFSVAGIFPLKASL